MIAPLPPAFYTTTDEFCAAPHAHADRMRATGEAEVLLANGRPEAVVMSPETYRELADLADYHDSVRRIRSSMQQFKEGRGVPAKEAIRKLANELGVKLAK